MAREYLAPTVADGLRRITNPMRAEERAILQGDLAGPLGLTQAEKNRQATSIARPAAGLAAGVAGQAARQGLAAGSQFAGAAQRAQMQALEQGTQAMSQAGAETERTSAQLAEARKQSILGRLAHEGETGRENLKGVLGGLGTAVGTAVGGPGGAAIGQLGGKALGAGLGMLGRAAVDYATGTPKASELPGATGPTLLSLPEPRSSAIAEQARLQTLAAQRDAVARAALEQMGVAPDLAPEDAELWDTQMGIAPAPEDPELIKPWDLMDMTGY